MCLRMRAVVWGNKADLMYIRRNQLRMKFPVTISLFLSAIAAATSCHSRQAADLVLFHGRIYTVDSAFSTVEALAVKDGKILAAGTDADIRGNYTAPDTVDLDGKAVYPGFIDAHGHFVEYGKFLFTAVLYG